MTAPCPVFVINLARDAERRVHMEERLQKCGLRAEFIAAVDGKSLTSADRASYDHARALVVYGSDMLDNEIGCYRSHFSIYERMVRENMSLALVLEDDVDLDDNLPAILADLAAETNPPWLVVRLETLRSKVQNPETPLFAGHRVRAVGSAALYRLDTHVLGFGGYLITLAGAKRMLTYGARIFMPVDQTMDRFWENGIVPYIVRPFPVRQREDRFSSSIGTRGAGRHYALPFSLRLRHRAQRVQDSIRKRLWRLRRRFATD